MQVLIAFLLACLVLILFYRLVERRHKILLAKVAAGLIVLLGLALGGLYLRRRREDAAYRQRRAAVSIEYVQAPTGPADTMGGNRYKGLFGPDTLRQVSFKLCNRGARAVEYVAFSPYAFLRGRSTPHDVQLPSARNGYVSNRFESDFVMEPKECNTLTWHGGRYLVLDSVSVTVESVHERGRDASN